MTCAEYTHSWLQRLSAKELATWKVRWKALLSVRKSICVCVRPLACACVRVCVWEKESPLLVCAAPLVKMLGMKGPSAASAALSNKALETFQNRHLSPL